MSESRIGRKMRTGSGMLYNLRHRGLLRAKGKEVFQFLQALITNDIRRLADGRAQYALLLNSRGRIVEDLILYRQAGMVTGSLVNSEGRRAGKVIACTGKKGLALVPISRNTSPTHFQSMNEDIEIFLPPWWPADPFSVSSRSL
ncbi:hypothetical protein LOAG_18340 [Loa loa]|uniref:Uncharacterized protein n=1 Tax=Loa loa TaxID=7209 RepID=A0A1S0UG47_LOALO|nr:hypothetical protein LOAG_18340 [Loa loa]EJD74338.1 hypothetical protein LOAG_18340 [Loa loa]